MTADLFDDHDQLVLHVIPSPRGRGAQRAARILVDRLDEPGTVRHRLLSLLHVPPEVKVDLTLGELASSRPAGFQPQIALRLRRMVSRLDPVAVVAHGGDAMKYVVPALIGTGRPLVYCNIGTYSGPPARLHELAWRVISRRADIVVAVGNEVALECESRFKMAPERVEMIPNGRDPLLYCPASGRGASGPATLMFVGALTPQKRPELFIEVVRRLRAKGYEIRAQMVGDGPLAATLVPQASSQRVELLGSRSDVPDLLRCADIFLFTSLPTGEGMPGVLIEAGLSGLPVVATIVPGVTTILRDGDTGLIVDGPADSIVAAVKGLLDDRDRRTAMGASARSRCVAEFSLDLMAERWRATLQSVIDGQAESARRGALGLARRVCARRRAIRSRRDSSQI
jgi:glycosyltransferase involved in cell wall biosynthesis